MALLFSHPFSSSGLPWTRLTLAAVAAVEASEAAAASAEAEASVVAAVFAVAALMFRVRLLEPESAHDHTPRIPSPALGPAEAGTGQVIQAIGQAIPVIGQATGGGGYYPWGAAAIGAGLAYQDCYYNYNGYCNGYTGGYYEGSGTSDAIEACAQRFRSYDRASQTYLSKKGKRVSCP